MSPIGKPWARFDLTVLHDWVASRMTLTLTGLLLTTLGAVRASLQLTDGPSKRNHMEAIALVTPLTAYQNWEVGDGCAAYQATQQWLQWASFPLVNLHNANYKSSRIQVLSGHTGWARMKWKDCNCKCSLCQLDAFGAENAALLLLPTMPLTTINIQAAFPLTMVTVGDLLEPKAPIWVKAS